MAATILVVEDEPAIQDLISYSLRQARHIVFSARNAEEAMEIINDALPDLVLLDWMLPGMSGIEFARVLRRTARTKTIPIIMLTARAEEGDKVAGWRSGPTITLPSLSLRVRCSRESRRCCGGARPKQPTIWSRSVDCTWTRLLIA